METLIYSVCNLYEFTDFDEEWGLLNTEFNEKYGIDRIYEIFFENYGSLLYHPGIIEGNIMIRDELK